MRRVFQRLRWGSVAIVLAVVGGDSPAAQEPGGFGTLQLFTGARIIVGDGRVVEDAALLVRGDQIIDVGQADTVGTPTGAMEVDLTGQTVMPALVNTHAHLGWEGYTSWGLANFTRDTLIDHLHRHAYYGVGTIISTGSDLEDVALEVRQAQRLGEVGGARYLVSPDWVQ